MISQQTIKDIFTDIAKIGTMLIVSQVLLSSVDSNAEKITNPAFILAVSYTLIGFAIYHIITKRIIKTSGIHNTIIKNVLDDWLKVGTMMIISRALSRQSFNEEWVRNSLITLIGFTTYDIFTKKIIPNKGKKNITMDMIDDFIKFGTMLFISELLSGGSINKKWIQGTVFTFIGLATYNLIVRKITGL